MPLSSHLFSPQFSHAIQPSIQPTIQPSHSAIHCKFSMQPSLQPTLPAGAPTPPDIYSEPLALTLPDYNMYPPATGQVGRAGVHWKLRLQGAPLPPQSRCTPPRAILKERDGKPSSTRTTTTCTTSTMIAEGVYASCPYLDESGCCPDEKISEVSDAPNKYKSKQQQGGISKAVHLQVQRVLCLILPGGYRYRRRRVLR